MLPIRRSVLSAATIGTVLFKSLHPDSLHPAFITLLLILGLAPAMYLTARLIAYLNDGAFLIQSGLKSRTEVSADICWTHGLATAFAFTAFLFINDVSDVELRLNPWHSVLVLVIALSTLFGAAIKLSIGKQARNAYYAEQREKS